MSPGLLHFKDKYIHISNELGGVSGVTKGGKPTLWQRFKVTWGTAGAMEGSSQACPFSWTTARILGASSACYRLE
jgi:hypothetical protein